MWYFTIYWVLTMHGAFSHTLHAYSYRLNNLVLGTTLMRGIVIILTLQTRKLRHEEVKYSGEWAA